MILYRLFPAFLLLAVLTLSACGGGPSPEEQRLTQLTTSQQQALSRVANDLARLENELNRDTSELARMRAELNDAAAKIVRLEAAAETRRNAITDLRTQLQQDIAAGQITAPAPERSGIWGLIRLLFIILVVLVVAYFLYKLVAKKDDYDDEDDIDDDLEDDEDLGFEDEEEDLEDDKKNPENK